MTIGFIGCGALGSAILRGAVKAQALTGADIVLADYYPVAATALAKELGAKVALSNAELVEQCDLVVIAVKPHQIRGVLTEISAATSHSPVIASVAAGVKISAIEAELPAGIAVIRVMPNVNAAIGQSMTALAKGSAADDEHIARVEQIFSTIGKTTVLAENLFPVFTAIAGSTPGWVARYIDALATAAVGHGMTKAQAVEVVTQAVAGSALNLQAQLAQGAIPQNLVDQVCSPAGMTTAGLRAATAAGFEVAAMAAVDAAVAKDKELGQ